MTAKALDNRRLLNQANEGARVLEARARVLGFIPIKQNKTGRIGWATHLTTRMWEGNEGYLAHIYLPAIVQECHRRGIAVEPHENAIAMVAMFFLDVSPPAWRDDARVLKSHQANLVFKEPAHYGPQFPGVRPMDGYWWPLDGGIDKRRDVAEAA